LWWLGDLAESVACRERAFALSRDRGDPSQAAFAAILLCMDQEKQYGNGVAALGWLAQATRLVDDNGLEDLRDGCSSRRRSPVTTRSAPNTWCATRTPSDSRRTIGIWSCARSARLGRRSSRRDVLNRSTAG
jgi:hypothetical protein